MPHFSSQCRRPSLPHRNVRRAGFTLIELLAVIALLAILAAISIGAARGVKQRAAIARAKADLAALSTALEEFKRACGDYPQLGAPEFSQAQLTPATAGNGPGIDTVQAKLFNCLTGVFGPRAFTPNDRSTGASFVDVSKLSLHPASFSATIREQNIGILDPWGRYYLYYYKSAGNPSQWQRPAYVLYSAGPDGDHSPLPSTGIFTAEQNSDARNLDNVSANL